VFLVALLDIELKHEFVEVVRGQPHVTKTRILRTVTQGLQMPVDCCPGRQPVTSSGDDSVEVTAEHADIQVAVHPQDAPHSVLDRHPAREPPR
jgi:hypothetical protein